MIALNSVRAILRVRRRIQDTNSVAFTDDEVLEALDDALQPIYTTVRQAGRGDEMDLLAVARTTLTEIAEQVLEFTLPETVGEVRLIEGVVSDTLKGVPLLHAQHLHEKDAGRGFGSLGQAVWFYSMGSRPGTIQIRGRSLEFTSFNIWHARKWPPLHYGTAAAGAAASITFPTVSAAGDVFLRDDLYNGMDIEITADAAQATNVGAMRRVSDYVGSTRIATVSVAWPAVTSATTVYALVVPLEPEYTEYLIEEASYELFSQLGEPEQIMAMEGRLRFLRDRFTTGLQTRQTQEGLRLWSGRGGRV